MEHPLEHPGRAVYHFLLDFILESFLLLVDLADVGIGFVQTTFQTAHLGFVFFDFTMGSRELSFHFLTHTHGILFQGS